MVRKLLLVAACGLMMGSTCQLGLPALTCANDLDATQFGFTMTIPAEFGCADQLPSFFIQPPLLAVVIYEQSDAQRSLTVLVREPGQQGEDPSTETGFTYEDLPSHTNPDNLVFELRRGTSNTDGTVQYIAAAELPGGNLLGIFLDAPTDDASLLTTFTAVLDAVQLTD